MEGAAKDNHSIHSAPLRKEMKDTPANQACLVGWGWVELNCGLWAQRANPTKPNQQFNSNN